MNKFNRKRENLLIKFADIMKQSDSVNVPENRNKIQGDPEKIG